MAGGHTKTNPEPSKQEFSVAGGGLGKIETDYERPLKCALYSVGTAASSLEEPTGSAAAIITASVYGAKRLGNGLPP